MQRPGVGGGRGARARARHAQVAGYRGKFQRRILEARSRGCRLIFRRSLRSYLWPPTCCVEYDAYSVLPGESPAFAIGSDVRVLPADEALESRVRTIHRARASCSSIYRPSRSPRDAIIMRRCGTSGASLRPPSSRFRHQRAITMFVTLSGS